MSSTRVLEHREAERTKARGGARQGASGASQGMMRSRIPRYHQIAQSLRERIGQGRPAAGERLDNQRKLAREFNVTLMTLRQALELLERDGLITRRHGLGTFVASPVVDYDILHLRTFAGDLSAKGAHVATRFRRSHFVAADR